MTIKRVLTWVSIGAALAACESGDINLQPTNVSTGGGGGGGGTTNPCAAYTVGGATQQGSFDGANCTYSSTFASAANPITVDLQIPFISGVHIFQDSLFVGADVATGAAPAGGTGPKLIIDAGQHAGLPGFGGLPAHQSRFADPRQRPRQRANYDHGFHGRREPHGRSLRRPALGRPRDQRQRHHEQLHGRAAHERRHAMSFRRANRRTTAATTTPRAPAFCATS